MSYFSHPTAVMDEGSTIGKNTKIWHFCHVMSSAVIGENCVLGQNVFIGSKVSIGKGVKIQNNVSVYEGVKLEDEVFVGPSVVFTNVINPRAGIERKDEFKSTLVGKGASIGANSTLICGVTVGRYALIGAGSVVTKEVPDFAMVYGNPAKQQGWVSKAGHKLSFDTDNNAQCPETGETYRLINEGFEWKCILAE